jgi:hypothetical protein
MVGSQSSAEGSITASLRELERLEEERLREEREQAQRRRDAEADARLATERRVEEERLAGERRAEAAWLARVRLEREDAERATAMEHAFVEQAKAETMARAAAVEREREHAREVERAAAAGTSAIARTRRVAVASCVGLVLAVIACAWICVGGIAPRWERRLAAMSEEVAARDRTIDELEAKLAIDAGDVAAERRGLRAAGDRVAALEAQVMELAREVDRLRRARGVAAPFMPHAPDAVFSTHCDPGSHDPLCATMGK